MAYQENVSDQTCQCREDMRWNSNALECQVNRNDATEDKMSSQMWIVQLYLDVDCSHLNYTTPVSEEVLAAAKKVKRRKLVFLLHNRKRYYVIWTFDKRNAFLTRLSKRGGVGSTRLTRRERFSNCQLFTTRPSCTGGLESARPTMQGTSAVLYSRTNSVAAHFTGIVSELI